MDLEVSWVEPDRELAFVNISHLAELLIRTKTVVEESNRIIRRRKSNPHKSAVLTIASRGAGSSLRTFDLMPSRASEEL